MAGVKGMRDKLLSSPVRIEKFRASVRVALIRNRLTKHILGELEMSATQVRACEILLARTIPAVAQMEHTGEVTHNYVARTPEVAKSTEDWAKAHAPQPAVH